MIYDMAVEREGKFWSIRLPALDFADMARDSIAITPGRSHRLVRHALSLKD